MVRITEQLIRKKSEHNELIISTLEELSLHQEDIERIEHFQHWCRDLKILLLQNNLIGRIENVYRLKRLEYLNLAVNNIEVIENLYQLESLEKLDLTLNFVGDLTSVESLRPNYNLTDLILTGNPCCDFDAYRDYVITVLPQLERLDCVEVTPTIRLKAAHNFTSKRKRIVQQQVEYRIRRDEQRTRVQIELEREAIENRDLDDDEINEKFWKKKSEHCPETRVDIARQHRKVNKTDEPATNGKELKPIPRLFAECGRPYNVNQAKIEFQLVDEPDRYELSLSVYKFMDTSLIDVDVQPYYIRATIKKKVFQMTLSDEVRTGLTTLQRSMITGHLLIVMPKVKCSSPLISAEKTKSKNDHVKPRIASSTLGQSVDYKNIVSKINQIDNKITIKPEFNDNPEVPPLI